MTAETETGHPGLNSWWNMMMMRLCLRTAPIVHPPGDMWAWRARAMMMIMMMSAEDNSWLVHQRSLAVLLAETSGRSRRNGEKSENFVCQYLKHLKGF
jgi:hypothetical protein